jgi:hypothetical protein
MGPRHLKPWNGAAPMGCPFRTVTCQVRRLR